MVTQRPSGHTMITQLSPGGSAMLNQWSSNRSWFVPRHKPQDLRMDSVFSWLQRSSDDKGTWNVNKNIKDPKKQKERKIKRSFYSMDFYSCSWKIQTVRIFKQTQFSVIICVYLTSFWTTYVPPLSIKNSWSYGIEHKNSHFKKTPGFNVCVFFIML